MRLRQLYALILVCAAAVLGSSCMQEKSRDPNAPREFFSGGRVGSSPDFAVIKFDNPRDHVLTVHGFADDAATCVEIAEALNVNACKETGGENCLNPFSCEALNQ